MKRFELIAVLAVIASAILKFFFVKLSNQIFFLSSIGLAVFYFGFSVFLLNSNNTTASKYSLKGVSTGRIIGAIGLGITFSTIIIGLCFKFLMLSGASQMLFIGGVELIVIGLVAMIVAIAKHKLREVFYLDIFKRVILFLIVSIIIFFTPSTTLIDIYFRNYPVYRDLLKKSLSDPNSVNGDELDQEYEKIK